MRRPMFSSASGLVPLIAAMLMLQCCGVKVEPYISTCQADAEIPTATRNEIEAAAIEILGQASSASSTAIEDLMSTRGKADTVSGATEQLTAYFKSMSPTSAPTVSETYFVTSSGSAEINSSVPCAAHDGRMAFIPRGGTPKNALVVLNQALNGKSKLRTTLWLELEENRWLARGIHSGLGAIAGLDSEALWALAKSQRSKGNFFNAHIIYGAALTTLSSVAFFQPSIANDVNQDFQTFKPLQFMEGQPPFAWRFGDDTFSVDGVQYMGDKNGQVSLLIFHNQAWVTEDQADAVNRRLIEEFDQAYPEWREVFGYIVARVVNNETKRGWGTVFDKDKGYLDPP